MSFKNVYNKIQLQLEQVVNVLEYVLSTKKIWYIHKQYQGSWETGHKVITQISAFNSGEQELQQMCILTEWMKSAAKKHKQASKVERQWNEVKQSRNKQIAAAYHRFALTIT